MTDETQPHTPDPAAIDRTLKLLADMHHDQVVVMQAAWIEWQHGKGAEAAMQWIENTLEGPGLIPEEDEPYSTDAQKYHAANQANPMPRCHICGEPSIIGWMNYGFCCEEHYSQGRAQLEAKPSNEGNA